MEKRTKVILILVTMLALGAAAGITVNLSGRNAGRVNEMRVFQRAVGGLGLGAIAAPMWQFLNYDFRVQSCDDSLSWPVPGGYSYGPDRTATVTYFQEPAGHQWVIVKP